MLNQISQIKNTLSLPILWILISIDIGFIFIHIWIKLFSIEAVRYSLITDGGYPELFQYSKEYIILITLFFLAWKTRAPAYKALSILFIYALANEVLQIHVTIGGYLANYFHFSIYLGEFVFLSITGAFILGYIATSTLRTDKQFQLDIVNIIILLGLFLLFAVCIDLATKLLDGYHLTGYHLRGMTVLEDGGEMLVMSIIFAYMFGLIIKIATE